MAILNTFQVLGACLLQARGSSSSTCEYELIWYGKCGGTTKTTTLTKDYKCVVIFTATHTFDSSTTQSKGGSAYNNGTSLTAVCECNLGSNGGHGTSCGQSTFIINTPSTIKTGNTIGVYVWGNLGGGVAVGVPA